MRSSIREDWTWEAFSQHACSQSVWHLFHLHASVCRPCLLAFTIFCMFHSQDLQCLWWSLPSFLFSLSLLAIELLPIIGLYAIGKHVETDVENVLQTFLFCTTWVIKPRHVPETLLWISGMAESLENHEKTENPKRTERLEAWKMRYIWEENSICQCVGCSQASTQSGDCLCALS
jgi:hypothetical protein